jgi:cytosine permease
MVTSTVSNEAQSATGVVGAAEDHAASELPESEQRSTLSVTLVRMGYTVSATDLLFGMSLGLYFDFWTALAVAIGSSILICVNSILCGLIGQREGLTTALITRMVFGREGSRVPSLVIAVISVGFVGYSTAITANVLPGHTHAFWLFYVVGLSILYTVLSSVGFVKGLTWVGRVSVPLMIVAVLVAVAAAISHAGGWSQIVNGEPAQAGKMGVMAMIALGIAKWMQGSTVSPDITRFAKGPGAVYTTTIAEFIVGNLGFNLLGIILGLAVGTGNMGEAFSTVGVGALAAVAIFVQGFPHEVNNLYAGSLAGRNALGIPRLYVNIISGILAAALAYYGLTQGVLHSFLKYLSYVAYAMPLIPGIMIADYFLIHRGHYSHRVSDAAIVNWRAVWAFVIGLAINVYLGVAVADSLWHALPLIGLVLYLIFSWRQLTAAWTSRAMVSARNPL